MKTLFNPFTRIVGAKSLIWGFVFIAFTSLIMCFGGVVQDSYMHFAYQNSSINWWQIVIMQFAMWLLPAMTFYFCGIILSKSKIRIIDILGTTAFSQVLLIPIIAAMLMPYMRGVIETLTTRTDALTTYDLITAIVWGVCSLIFCIMFWIWNYHAFSKSSNVKGRKAIFIYIALIIAITIVSIFISRMILL